MHKNWKDLLKRANDEDAWLELRRGDMWLCGPIHSAQRILAPYIQLQWSARRTTSWSVWDYLAGFSFTPELWPTARDNGTTADIKPRPGKFRGQYWGRIYFAGSRLPFDPDRVAGLPRPVDYRQNWRFPRVNLTQAEWVALCGTGNWRADDDYPALPVCCANISALRNAIQHVQANGGFVWPASAHDLKETHGWVFGPDGHGHDGQDWSTLNKFMSQAVPGLKLPTAANGR